MDDRSQRCCREKINELNRSTLFAHQFISGPQRIALPDNWDGDHLKASYFSQVHSSAKTPSPTLPTSSKWSSNKQAPAERQAALNSAARGRVLQSMMEQQQADDERMRRCKDQREVTRLKLLQRTKQRVETQAESRQAVCGKYLPLLSDFMQKPLLTRTLSSVHKAEVAAEPQRLFVEFNSERMERNLLHRHYCIAAIDEQKNFRQQLEHYCGSMFSQKKSKALAGMGITGTEAVISRYPTMSEQHAADPSTMQQHLEEEKQLSRRCMAETERLDNALYTRRQGQQKSRCRDILYNMNTSHHRPNNLPSIL